MVDFKPAAGNGGDVDDLASLAGDGQSAMAALQAVAECGQ
jgi:hypothetical protein